MAQTMQPPATEPKLIEAYGEIKRALEAAQAMGAYTIQDSVRLYNATTILETWLKPMSDKLQSIALAAQNEAAKGNGQPSPVAAEAIEKAKEALAERIESTQQPTVEEVVEKVAQEQGTAPAKQ